MKRVFVLSLVGLLAPFLVWAQVAPVAPPDALTAGRIMKILTGIANFLIAVGIIGAVITIVTAGIIYFFHGFSANAVTKAKGVFKNALIGTLLVLSVGVIINTVRVIITGEFFGTVGSPTGPPGPAGGAACPGGDDSYCAIPSQKGQPGTFCVADICTRGICFDPKDCKNNPIITGNLTGESCRKSSNCASGLTCKDIKYGVGLCKR